MYCRNCGKEIKDPTKFCAYCGTPIISNEQKKIENSKSSSGIKIFIALIMFMCVLCVIFTIIPEKERSEQIMPIPVCKDGLYGYINEKGEEVIRCQYNEVKEFMPNGMAAVVNAEGKYGYINEDGIEVIPCQYKYAGNFTSVGIAMVADEEGKYGYIDEDGTKVVSCQYSNASAFMDNGIAMVADEEGKYAYINEKGELLTSFDYGFYEYGRDLRYK